MTPYIHYLLGLVVGGGVVFLLIRPWSRREAAPAPAPTRRYTVLMHQLRGSVTQAVSIDASGFDDAAARATALIEAGGTYAFIRAVRKD